MFPIYWRLMQVKLLPEMPESDWQIILAVEVREMIIPNDFPNENFDLILFSEVGYFLSRDDLEIAKEKMINALSPKGHLLMVHWTPVVEEFPLTGDEVHELFIKSAGNEKSDPLIHLYGRREDQYRLDLFEKKTELS